MIAKCGGPEAQAGWIQPCTVCGITKEDAGAMSGIGSKAKNESVPDDAFISPDEPLVTDKFREAIISPDDPLPPPEAEDEGGVVVGMDGSTKHEVTSGAMLLDADQVAAVLEAVAAELRDQSINGLQVEPGASEFEVALKNHLMEYFSNYS